MTIRASISQLKHYMLDKGKVFQLSDKFLQILMEENWPNVGALVLRIAIKTD